MLPANPFDTARQNTIWTGVEEKQVQVEVCAKEKAQSFEKCIDLIEKKITNYRKSVAQTHKRNVIGQMELKGTILRTV